MNTIEKIKSSGKSVLLFSVPFFLCLAVGCSSTKSDKTPGDETGDGTFSESDLAAKREARFGNSGIPSAEGEGMFRDVGFDYSSAGLSDSARQDVEANGRILMDSSALKVTLEGHCDERGTTEFNMALGAERARAVKASLIGLGVASSRIETISYGEELPLDPGHDEAAYAKNRRVHFSVGQDSSRSTAPSKSRY